MKKIVTIIDYGMGNILSVKNVIEYLGYKCQVTNDHKIIKNGKFLILPGVGSFDHAMALLNSCRHLQSFLNLGF